MPASPRRRILIIDDNPSIHQDFQKILATSESSTSLDALEMAIFGSPQARGGGAYSFEVDSASQGEEGVQRVKEAAAEGRPYALAFVDIRMPPGIDGVETTALLWKADEDLQVVLCSAYADYSWEEVAQRLGINQRLLILRKPFDNIEVRQMAHALAQKWDLSRQSRRRQEELAQAVAERTQELQASNARLRQEMDDRARLEAQLAQSQRLEAMGRLASGMANEISSPLGFVSTNLNHLRLALEKRNAGVPLEDPAELLDACRDAIQGTDRLKRIVQDVKLFARVSPQPGVAVDVRKVLEQALTRIELPAGSRVQRVLELQEVPPVLASDEGLTQVFLNLISNAIQALPADHPEPRLRLGTRPQGADAVVEIQDNGAGIEAEHLSHIFEPFYTTKPGGSGLGLSICHGIITGFGGEISVESAPGKGTTFRIKLPRAA
ncbi:hybrid sensor histidine kinase/response regulator [Hyalangium versicolor]|uniref:hybrid sensor histidine kinase/response regulator n=1 Tax=Hyalangium versicolor TaxID=2861190 RepID=UPI001CCB44CB|nr:ATP-binding protein [Hyalangium versicolor]